MDSQIKLIGLATVALMLVLTVASVGKQIFETNNAGFYQIKQASLTGEMTVIADPGTYLQMFANITTYQISDVYYFSKTEGDGRVAVLRQGNSFVFADGFGLNDVIPGDQLREVFRDGKLLVDDSFSAIRERIQSTK